MKEITKSITTYTDGSVVEYDGEGNVTAYTAAVAPEVTTTGAEDTTPQTDTVTTDPVEPGDVATA